MTLMSAQAALAIPPNPARDGREELALEALAQEQLMPGKVYSKDLDSLRTDVPADLVEAPAGTATAPEGKTGTATFPSGTARAAVAAEVPVAGVPVSLGPVEGETAPAGTWQVTVKDRAATVAEGVDGALLTLEAPAGSTAPVSVKVDYARFKNLYGAEWGSRLRVVQFPACYLTTPELEECQEYEELPTLNDPATGTVTATVDPAADPADGEAAVTGVPGLSAQSGALRALAAAGAGGSATVLGVTDSGESATGSFKATPLASSGKWAAGNSSGAFTWSYP